MTKRLLLVLTALVCTFCLAFGLAACKSNDDNGDNSDTTTVAVESVALNKTELTLEVGGSETLTATVKPDNATDKTVTWSIAPEGIATVANGKVTAVAAGTATVTATAGGKSATCSVKVNAKTQTTVAVESVTLNKTELTLEINVSETLTATVTPENATDKNVTWTVEPAEGIVTVVNGLVTAVGVGDAVVTATADGKSATCKVTVIAAPTPTTGLSYTINSGNASYTCSGIGSASSVTDIVIASEYNGKPVIAIKERAFKDNTKIKSVYIPGSVETINTYAFSGCTNLESVTISYGVKTINASAFRGSGLKSVVVPDSVTDLMGSVFQECASLESVQLSSSLTAIRGSLFNQCVKLKKVVIPEGVTEFPYATMVFQNCVELEELVLPSTLKSVYGGDSFYNDMKLITVTYNGTMQDWIALGRDDWFTSSGVKYVKCADGQTYVLATEINIATTSFNVAVGGTVQLNATVNADATIQTIKIENIIEGKLSVNEDGSIKALAAGTYSIRLRAGRVTQTVIITVS